MAFSIIDRWKKLPKFARRAILIAVALVALAIAPEIIPLLDVGGIELVLLFIFSYYKPIFRFLSRQFDHSKYLYTCWRIALMSSMLAKPRIFTTCSAITFTFLVVTGSIIPAYVFWLPAFFPQASA